MLPKINISKKKIIN